MIKQLNVSIVALSIIAVVVVAWRIDYDIRQRRIASDLVSRSHFPSAPAWCYPGDGSPRPTDVDFRIKHLTECYPNIKGK